MISSDNAQVTDSNGIVDVQIDDYGEDLDIIVRLKWGFKSKDEKRIRFNVIQ